MKIKYDDKVVACRIKETVFVHPKLEQDKELYDAIMKHEKGHTKSFSKKDFFHDLNNDELKGLKKNFYSFIIKNPKTLQSFLPISKAGKHWVYDINITIFWCFTIIIGGLVWIKM